MRVLSVVVLSSLSLLVPSTGESQAQPNWRGTPTYETVNLSGGFTPDPWSRPVQAGGPDRVSSTLGPGCVGFITNAAPDVDLNFTAGSLPLHIHVESATDTTLVVNAPDGRWYCNDDAIGLNPVVTFNPAQSGNYNIFVGVHGSNQLAPATLHITELDPRTRATAAAAQAVRPNWAATPTFTTVNLTAGFMPDPWQFNIQAGGENEITGALGSGCRGYIHAAAPDIDLNYESGGLSLYIHARSDADTTIAVLDPAGNWHCNDDAIGLNPMVSFERPLSGNYNIWVGVLGSSQTRPATVYVTELDPRN